MAWLTPGLGEQRLVERQHPALLVGLVDRVRVDLVRRHPGGLGVDRLVGQLHRAGVSGRDTRAVATARSASRAAAAVVRVMPAAKPQTPSCTTRTDSPSTGRLGGGLQRVVAEAAVGLGDAFDAYVGVLAAQLPGPGEGGVGQSAQRQRQ